MALVLGLSVLGVPSTFASDVTVPITQISNVNDPFLPSLPTGTTQFGGVTFDMPPTRDLWVGNLGNQGPDLSGTFNVNIASPGSARLLIMTGNTFSSLMAVGDRIGTLVFRYASGPDLTVPLLVGVNVREWAVGASGYIVTSTDPALQEVWRGIDTRGITSVVDMLTVPLDGSRTLTQVSISDESIARIGLTDPNLALRALTVQLIPEPAALALPAALLSVATRRRRHQTNLPRNSASNSR